MWKLAWRNIWRNRTRTLILLTAIALPYAMMIVSFGFIEDFLGKMEEKTAESVGGSVLIHGEGYWSTKSNDTVVDEPAAVSEAVEGAEGVRAAIPRVLISGMLSSPQGAVGVQIRGIDREQEAKVQDFSKYLTEGDFLSGEHERPIVLGAGLVERLEVELGDKVVLTASDAEGEVTRALFRLRGIVEAGSDQLDEVTAITSIAVAQEAIALGERVHQIGVLAGEGVDSVPLAEAIRSNLGERAGGLEVLTWQRAMPEMVSYLAIERGGMTVMLVIVFIIVSFVIANTFLMSVMERVREFGLFSALGLDDWRIGKLVFAETLLLTLVAVVVGFGLGLGGHFAIDHYGIDMAQMVDGEMQVSGVGVSDLVMRSRITPIKWLWGTAGVVGLIFLSAAYPAWKATKLAPTKAMEFYEH